MGAPPPGTSTVENAASGVGSTPTFTVSPVAVASVHAMARPPSGAGAIEGSDASAPSGETNRDAANGPSSVSAATLIRPASSSEALVNATWRTPALSNATSGVIAFGSPVETAWITSGSPSAPWTA